LAFFLFSLLTKRWLGILLISGLVLLWTSGSAVKLILQKREIDKMGGADPAPQPVVPAGIDSTQNKEYVIPERFSHFSSLSTPRRLKMKRVFRYLTFLLTFIALAFTNVSYSLLVPPHKAPDDQRIGARIGLITFGIYCVLCGGWWLERRRKRLLKTGRSGFAIILNSNAGRGALLPGITYKFLTESGKEIEDFDQDWTDSFHEGMVVPVFYDASAPENHVAMCASFYDVL
jgi:hypothetical protein